MKTFILSLATLLVFSCSSTKELTSVEKTSDFSSKNDTIFYKSEPTGLVIHYGVMVNKHNKFSQVIVVNEMLTKEDVTLGMINYIHKIHPNSVVEVRVK